MKTLRLNHGLDVKALRAFLVAAGRALRLNGLVGVRLMDDVSIRALNRLFRHHDAPTDVLSFPVGDALSASTRPLPGIEARPQPDQRRGPQSARALGWQREGVPSQGWPCHPAGAPRGPQPVERQRVARRTRPGVAAAGTGSRAGSRASQSLPPYLGDLAISVETARRQARAQAHSLDAEVRILLLHGLLHLAGYDHETDRGQMRRLEATLRRRFRLPPGLIERHSGRKIVV